MSQPTLRQFRTRYDKNIETSELIVDFSNDYHFSVAVEFPGTPEQVRDALVHLALMIDHKSREWEE